MSKLSRPPAWAPPVISALNTLTAIVRPKASIVDNEEFKKHTRIPNGFVLVCETEVDSLIAKAVPKDHVVLPHTHPPRVFFFIETYADNKCRFSADYPGFLASDDASQVDASKKAPALSHMYEKGIETAYMRFVEQHPEYSLSRAKFFDDLKV